MNKELINKIKLKIEKTFGLARIYIYSIRMVRKNRTYICLSCSDVDGMLKEIDTESPIGKEIATFGMDSFEVKKEKCFVTSNKEKILNAYNEQVIKHEAIYRGYNKCK